MTTQTVQEVATNVWAEIYEALTKRGVVFPDNFDGIGAAYAGHTILANTLTQERTRLKEEMMKELRFKLAKVPEAQHKTGEKNDKAIWKSDVLYALSKINK